MSHLLQNPLPPNEQQEQNERRIVNLTEVLLVVVLLSLLAFIIFPLRNYIPIWDGSYILNCIFASTTGAFKLLKFRCADHPSVAYLLLLGAPQYIFPGSIFSIFIVNVILDLLAAFSLYGIYRYFFKVYSREALIGSFIFIFSPLILSHAFHITLDFGLTAFLSIFLYFLLTEKYWFSCIIGLALIFTKETALLLYCSAALIQSIIKFHNFSSWKERLMQGKKMLPLCIPILVFILYLFALYINGVSRFIWANSNKPMNWLDLLFNIQLDQGMQWYLFNGFILNFNWVLSAGILFFIFCLPWKWKKLDLHQKNLILFLLVFLVSTLYIITRFRIWNIPRYTLPLHPILSLLFTCGVMISIKQHSIRLILLSCTLTIMFFSLSNSFDPISDFYYGTFNFGSHSMYDMGPAKRDSLMYNLEGTTISRLTVLALADVPKFDNVEYLTGPQMWFNWWPKMQPVKNIRPPRYSQIQWKELGSNPSSLGNPKYIVYFEFPSTKNSQSLFYIRRKYIEESTKKYDINGYSMTVRIFRSIISTN